MNSKERVLAAINHKEPDTIPVDFGATPVTGVHVLAIERLRDHYGLEKRPVKVIEPYQMLGEIDSDLMEVLGVDVIGLSYLSGEHLIFTPKIVNEMKKAELDDTLLIAGGTFPVEDIPTLESMGIDKVFRAGSLTDSISDYIFQNIEV